jgi:hypothetical protein
MWAVQALAGQDGGHEDEWSRLRVACGSWDESGGTIRELGRRLALGGCC